MESNFKERLKKYRKELNIKTKREMARKIGISEQLYYMLESGSRKPSKEVLEKLFFISKKPEEYWLYGITLSEHIEEKENFKCIKSTIEQLIKIGLLKEPNDYFKSIVHEMLENAMKTDIICLMKRLSDTNKE